jgi:hypothetical protein
MSLVVRSNIEPKFDTFENYKVLLCINDIK